MKSPNKPRGPRRPSSHGEPYMRTKAETLETAKGEPTAARHVEGPGAEVMEGRSPTKGNAGQQNARRTQRRVSAPNALDRVREAARKTAAARLTKVGAR